MTQLSNKVALISGASSGIGRAAAQLFAAEGAKLVLTARRKHLLDDVVAEIGANGGEAVALAGEVTDEDHAMALVELATDRFGGLDIAFNNAGATGATMPGIEMTRSAFEEAIAVNLTGAFLMAKHQIPAMIARGGGSVIFTGSFVGHTVGFPGMTGYAAAKAGLIGLTQQLAAENGSSGVRVNALLPGGTDTPGTREVMPDAETRAFIEGLYPLARLARAEEIARTAMFLASDAAGFVTGAAWLADGGISVKRV